MAKIKLEIVTAERLVYSEDVDGIIAPGVGGELGILPQHAPFMTVIMPGMITVKQGGSELDMAVTGGFMEVRPERVIILADAAERADEIDIARAEEARRRAEEAKANAATAGAEAQMAAEAALSRALTRIKVAQRRRREKPV